MPVLQDDLRRRLFGPATYVCKKCDARFQEPLYIDEREYADYGIGGEWITTFEGHVCPECESTNFEMEDSDNED